MGASERGSHESGTVRRTVKRARMIPTMSDETRRQRWEAMAEWPLTIAAVLFLGAYAVPILRPDLVSPLPTLCWLVT